MNTRLPLALILSAALTASVCAQEWTRFRGPNGSGISSSKAIPSEISDGDILWKTDLPGVGHSSPVIWMDKVFVTTTGDQSGGFSTVCADAKSGAIRWTRDFPLKPFNKHKFNSFASATPAVSKDAVYVVWNEPDHYFVAALSHEGNVIWQRDLGAFVSQHACGTSPILDGDMIVLGADQDDQKAVPGSERSGESFIIALDAKTGETRWKTPRKSVVVAYSTPSVYQNASGSRALIFNSQAHGIYALDPSSGNVLWEFDSAFNKRSVSSPVICGDIIFGSCGSGGGGNYVTAVRVPRASENTAPALAYQIKNAAPYVPTGLCVGDMVWLWSDGGILSCVHGPTGEVHYQERVGGNFFGSPIWVDHRLFCISTSGEIVVTEASKNFRVIHRFGLGELCHSTPAVSGDRMFIHTEKRLICIGAAPKQP